MSNEDTGNETVDKALRMFVYGPVGLACYLRDSAPTFVELFVSRGKREVDGARRTVEERLGLGKPAPASPSVQERVAGGFGRMASQASSVVAAMAGPVMNATNGTPRPAPPGAGGAGGEAPQPTGVPSVGNPVTAVRGGVEATAGHEHDLPIAGYDLLSASQVIERLDGLSRGALERIRVHELAHRARRTILASIDQLTT